MSRSQRKVPNRYSLNRPEHLFYLALGSAIGIGNIFVLPSLMARYGVSSVFLTHLFLLMFVSFPLVLSEMLWSRWLQRSLGDSFDIVPKFGKLFWGLLVVLWIDLTPSYIVEYSRVILSLARLHWRESAEQFLRRMHDESIHESMIVYLVSVSAVVIGTLLASISKSQLIKVYRWGLGLIAISGLVIFIVLVGSVDFGFAKSRLQILDFSRFGIDQLMEILTYSLFSMSVGIGIYFAYVFYGSQSPVGLAEVGSSFWKKPGNLFRLTLRVFAIDLLFSVLALFLLLPHLNSSGNYAAHLGEFQSPEYFALFLFPKYLEGTTVLAGISIWAYFCIILIAGLFSLVSLIDVAFWTFDFELKLSLNKKKVLLIFLLILLLAAPLLPVIRDLVSDFGSGVLLPISALCWSLAAGWAIPKKVQSMLMGHGPRMDGFFILWRFSVRWLLPLIFFSLFVLRGLKRFGM